MLALGNSEKCSRCIQTDTPFTVGSHQKMTVSVRFRLEKRSRFVNSKRELSKYMGRQMYFYYLEWLFVYNQNNVGYLQITTLQFHYF